MAASTSVPYISVVAPCYNEQDNLVELHRQVDAALSGLPGGFELILVDDGSTDETWQRIEEIVERAPEVRGVRLPENAGMFAAWRAGVVNARAQMVCLIDADLQNPPGEILSLMERFRDGRADLVQGTRSSIEWNRDLRYRASRALNLMLNVAFRDRARDSKSGFVLGPTSVVDRVLSFERKYSYPQTFIRVAARSLGYLVIEEETLFRPRRAGESFLTSSPAWRVYVDVLKDFPPALREFGRGSKHPTESLTRFITYGDPVDAEETLPQRVRRNIYFATMPAHAWLVSGDTHDYYKWLKKSQWFSVDELENLQWQRLSQLIWHAYQNVPYYRRLFFRMGLHPSDIRSKADLALIPMLEKHDVRKSLYMQLFSTNHDKRQMLRIATSGSTGEPFVTYADRQQLEVRFASTLRALEWTGWRFGDRQLRLWHQRLGMTPSMALRERLDAALLNRTFVPAFELSETSMHTLVQRIEEVQPVLMDGYAESFNFVASFLASGGALRAKPRAVMSSAQMLTGKTRRALEELLGAEVFDKYGAREFSGIAYECEAHDGHHVMDESYVVEILRNGEPAKPGELGEVVITDLNNYSVPLIRYRIGDLAVAHPNRTTCACERSLGRIGDIQGRTQALVHCANGRWLPGTFFAHFFKDYDHLVATYQVVQRERGSFHLKVVRGSQWSSSEWAIMMGELRTFVGDTVVNVDYVDEIPLLATGKRTPVVSSVQVDFQELA